MATSVHGESSFTNFLELRVVGLARSGNHAIINWILEQHAGEPCCFLNDIRHDGSDPYHTALESLSPGFPAAHTVEDIRREPKRLLVLSFEDDERTMDPRVPLVDSALNPESLARLRSHVGTSRHQFNSLIVRDPFNFFASRLKKLHVLGAVKDVPEIAANWKSIAARAFESLRESASPTITILFNRWVDDLNYRRTLSERLLGRFSDSSRHTVSPIGGGSSFDGTDYAPLTISKVLKNWRELRKLDNWMRFGFYAKRLFASGSKMNVTERWMLMQDDSQFRSIFADEEMLRLSEALFGEIPGTRDFVARCRRRHS